MTRNPYAPPKDKLPDILPIFPLEGVLLLPGGKLPLNIFEPRYLDMINAALAGHRMIGMIQPKDGKTLYNTGCAGKITEFSETEDGRYLITLRGISRFAVKEELSTTTDFRQIKPCWGHYDDDLDNKSCLGLDRDRFDRILRQYFEHEGMSCDWNAIKETPDSKLITCLAMACPLTPEDKQKILEAGCCKSRAELFIELLEFALCSGKECEHKH